MPSYCLLIKIHGTRCVTWYCKNYSSTTKQDNKLKFIRYHKIHRDESVRNQWITNCLNDVNNVNLNSSNVYCIHFTEDSFVRDNIKSEKIKL